MLQDTDFSSTLASLGASQGIFTETDRDFFHRRELPPYDPKGGSWICFFSDFDGLREKTLKQNPRKVTNRGNFPAFFLGNYTITTIKGLKMSQCCTEFSPHTGREG